MIYYSDNFCERTGVLSTVNKCAILKRNLKKRKKGGGRDERKTGADSERYASEKPDGNSTRCLELPLYSWHIVKSDRLKRRSFWCTLNFGTICLYMSGSDKRDVRLAETQTGKFDNLAIFGHNRCSP